MLPLPHTLTPYQQGSSMKKTMYLQLKELQNAAFMCVCWWWVYPAIMGVCWSPESTGEKKAMDMEGIGNPWYLQQEQISDTA